MIKLIVPLFNLLVFLSLQIFPGDVSVKMDVPARVDAGSEFEVKITLNKGDLEGFSRFQQNIPAGLTAESGLSSDADFSFSEKRVRLIWLRTPKTSEITVSYRVKVDEKLKGTFNLSGSFAYIDDNERKSVDIAPVAITIVPSAAVDPSLVVDVNDYEKQTLPYSGITQGVSSDVACIRQKPVSGSNGEFLVTLLVNKGTTQNFAKIEEEIPQGYTAVAVDVKDAIFTCKAQKVKILWMNMPLEPYFTVSYRLIPKNQATLPVPVLSGAFSYLVEEKTISLPIPESGLDLASLGNSEVGNLVAQVNALPAVSQTIQPQPEATGKTAVPATTARARKSSEPSGDPLSRTRLEPEQGVYYRIQLAAGHNPVNIERYFRKLKLDKQIRKEEHNGWQKYSVGSFHVYREARDYRVHIWNTTPVKDAFVTAYNSGQRITVQEALMVTEQQWYQ